MQGFRRGQEISSEALRDLHESTLPEGVRYRRSLRSIEVGFLCEVIMAIHWRFEKENEARKQVSGEWFEAILMTMMVVGVPILTESSIPVYIRRLKIAMPELKKEQIDKYYENARILTGLTTNLVELTAKKFLANQFENMGIELPKGYKKGVSV